MPGNRGGKEKRERGKWERRKRARSLENVRDGASTSTCCRCYCCCCHLRLGTGCGFPESSLFSHLSFSLLVALFLSSTIAPVFVPPTIFIFFSCLVLAFGRLRWSSLSLPPASFLWFADTPPSRLRIGVTKGALSVSVGWSGDPD